MPLDSFKWLPRSIAGYYRSIQVEEPEEIPSELTGAPEPEASPGS